MACLWDFDPICFDRKYFNDKYSNTIVLLNGVPNPIQIGESQAAVGDTVLEFSQSGIEAGLTAFLPDSQWILDPGPIAAPVYLRRQPRRQWHRSLHREQYEYSQPYLHGYTVTQYPHYAQLLQVARQITEKNYLTIDKAIQVLQKSDKHLGYVLSPEYALIRNSGVVYNLCNSVGIVGLVIPEHHIIMVNNRLHQEVFDFLHTSGNTEWNLQQTKCL